METETPILPEEQIINKPDKAAAKRLVLIKARNKRISLIVISLCLCMILAASITAVVHFLRQYAPTDDGKSLPNIYVGGVFVGDMHPEDIENVLLISVIPKLTSETMTVHLPNDSLQITSKEANISLDTKRLVEDIIAYGRSGSDWENYMTRLGATETVHHIALLPYLKIDLAQIRQSVDAFCSNYPTALVDPTVQLMGDRPVYGQASGVSVQHQTLIITMGQPQSALSAEDLYDTILDSYGLMQFELQYDVPITQEPAKPDAQRIFDELCVMPQDAHADPNSFVITKETYGYGFNVENVQRLIDRANFGQVIEIKLDFLLPDITESALDSNLFKDTLASYVSVCNDGTNTNRDKNLKLSCEALNGYILKVGESLDLDKLLGPRTYNRGYREAPLYSGSTASAIGGGINQTASALYYCALMAGLTINERHAHRYAVNYTPLGTDAALTYGSESLVFTNNTSAPIRILATADGSTVSITFLGTEDRNYSVKLEAVVNETYTPSTIYQQMPPDNVYGYINGQVIQNSVVGYAIEVYLCKYDPRTGQLLEKVLLHETRYESRDRIVIQIVTGEDFGEI